MADLFCNQRRLRGRPGFLRIQLAQHHHKLVATEARDRVQLAHAILQSRGGIDQQQIANVMAMGIVQRFEIVQIQKISAP